jgi:hypothetical protein
VRGGRREGEERREKRRARLTSWNLAACVGVSESIGRSSKVVEALNHVLSGAERVCHRARIQSSARRSSFLERKPKVILTSQRRLVEPKTRTIVLTLSLIIDRLHRTANLLPRLLHSGTLERERRVGKRVRLEGEGLDIALLEEEGLEWSEDEDS